MGQKISLRYLVAKLIQKAQIPAVLNCTVEGPGKIGPQSLVVNTRLGKYSYCGRHCTLINCNIGRYASIADHVVIGLSGHPVNWVSTSPAFYKCTARQSIPSDIASLEYEAAPPQTVVENDVWIGYGAKIKAGIRIGNGAVIAMGSVVTHDVPAYAIVGGNPARIIRYRFDENLIRSLLASRWWELDESTLKKHSHLMDSPEDFVKSIGREK